MYRRLPSSEKKALINRILAGETVSEVCKQEKISRTVFYKWLKENKSEPRRKDKNKRHWKRLDKQTEAKIIKFALSNPSFSPQKLASLLNLSSHGVWNVLKRNGFNKQEEREKHSLIYGTCLVKSQPASNKVTMIRRFEAGEKVSRICKDFGVSRTVFYRWLKRYNEANKSSLALENLRPNGEKHWRFIPGASDLILQVVVEHPEFSPVKIKEALIGLKGKQVVGSHGIYNLLKHLNLNTYQRRLAYANSQPQISAQGERALGWRLPGFIKFQFISDVSPPVIYSGLASAFVFLLLFFIVKIFSQGFGIIHTIGSAFSLLSLIFGMFFFAYSLKYYLTIAIVLSFSRQNSEEEEKEKGSFFSRIFGISITRDNSKDPPTSAFGRTSAFGSTESRFGQTKSARQGGLQPDLSNISLERQPFVSIHLATYNEKRVVDRLLTAATSMDYENYEVIVADDSKDETVELLDKWAKHPNVKILHRKSREGYKGGALKEALKVTNPKAEFIMIFDADFIPYPDTIVNFLKYFQNLCGNLKKNTLENSKIGAVQGYQWHVLNKSENWITRGVRSEYAGSYVIERSGEEIYSGLKQISGSVYMIQTHALKELGWGTSITEDFELTLRLYEKGYKVVYTPYIQAPAEAVSTIKRLIRQRMRWAEGHSFNVKAMFTRLLFSKNLTKSEKFEFLYLTPYYLQALLFMLGTFFWLVAEVIFKVRLPFWTEIWGWSLVFTNLFALPLMNMVGLFLEESEEKDYFGLFSFIALSYIVAPFQAYAALKGFTEKQEGPWFRTPKTGRITDIFTPGRFYRKIFGIFGRPSVSPLAQMSNNYQLSNSQYLALATANNKFDSFKIRPKKVRWIGKMSVVSILIFAIFLNIASFGHDSDSKVGQEIAKKPDSSKVAKDFKISGKNTFSQSETPTFRLTSPEPAQKAKSPLTRLFLTRVEASGPQIKTTLYDSNGIIVKNIQAELIKKDSDYAVNIKNTSGIKPGKYTLFAKWDDGYGHSYQSTQDFSWGVLAINTNKSVYTPNETVKFSFGVLDDRGSTICDVEKLTLDVQTPAGQSPLGGAKKEILSLSNGKIKKSGKCFGNKPSETPDYSAEMKVKEKGIYKLKLAAKTKNGEKSIEDKFEVKNDVPFDIERTSFPTRIPLNPPYNVFLTVKANKDFKGTIEESVPKNFEISTFDLNEGIAYVKENSVKNYSSSLIKGDKKNISWNADLKKGESIKVGYRVKFPQVSPQFYLTGPLRLVDTNQKTVFQEARQWQIAADAYSITFLEAGTDSTSDIKMFDGSYNTPSSSTTQKHTGPNSLKFDTTAGGVSTWIKTNTLTKAGTRIDMWYYLSWPGSANAELWAFTNSSDSNVAQLMIDTSGKLYFANGSGTLMGTAGTHAVGASAWHRISVAYTVTDATHNEFRAWVDGTADATVTNGTMGGDANAIHLIFGENGVANWGSSKVTYVDDIYADNDTSLLDPGDIRVTAKLPNAENTTEFNTAIGNARSATDYNNVNERPLSETNGWEDAPAAATSTTATYTANSSWISPMGVVSANVELYGAGGGGGKVSNGTAVRGGGGGGEYAAEHTLAVTQSTSYIITVGTAGTTAGGNGGNTTFNTTGVVANGGTGAGASATGGAGGTGSTNTVHYNGGKGVDGSGSNAGGGGGSGGTGSAGNTGVGSTGAVAVTGGYNGGNGRSGTTGAGSAPTDPYGGGGGGAYTSSRTTANGGAGAPGYAKVTYTNSPLSSMTDNFDDNFLSITKWEVNLSVWSAAEQNTEIEMTTTTGAGSASVNSKNSLKYDLTGSFMYVKLVDAGNLNLASYRVYYWAGIDSSNWVGFKLNDAGGKTIRAMHAISGVETTVGSAVSYNSSVHTWLRVRESGGTTYYDTSADGSTWTNLASEANPITLTAVKPVMNITGGAEATTTVTKFDNFNIGGTSGRVENYGIQNSATGDVDISGNTYVGYASWVWAKAGSGTIGTTNMFNNGTEVPITLTTTSTMFDNVVTSTSYPTNAAAVGMRANSGSAPTYFYEGGMLVAISGAPVPEVALVLGPLALFVPKIIKSIQKGTLVEDFQNLLVKLLSNIYKLFWSLPFLRRKKIIRDKRRKKRQRLRC